MRNLSITYRRVPHEGIPEYDRLWLALEDAARSRGLRAWRYRSFEEGDEFVEFIESAGADRRRPLPVESIRRSLEGVAPATADGNWREATPAAEPRAASPRSALLALLRERSLRRGDFVLTSGAHSTYYIDARPTTMSAAGQRLIGQLGLAELDGRGWAANVVGGLTLGADPVAYAIANAAALAGRSIDAFTVRKQAKAHGTGRRVEGNLSSNDAVVVVEDVMTSGKSALEAIEAVRSEGARVLGVLVVVDREAGGTERLTAEGLAVAALFTAKELLEE